MQTSGPQDEGADIDYVLRRDSETSKSYRKKCSEASKEADLDRSILPFITPVESWARTDQFKTLDPAHNIFIFVNPISGGNAGASFMDSNLEYVRLTWPEPVNIRIWDIRQGRSGAKPGFVALKQVLDGLSIQRKNNNTAAPSTANDLVLVIVAGGDGTVMWCITELWAHSIDDSKLALGVVPYGTGNDFARALGWQKYNAVDPYNNHFKILKELIQEWLQAKVVYHDIWDVNFRIDKNGTFKKIDPTSRSKEIVPTGICSSPLTKLTSHLETTTDSPKDSKELVLKMCNYFSLGIESRVGVGFDRYRTRNQFCNKVRYAVEGSKKAFFKKTNSLDSFLVRMLENHQGIPRTCFISEPNGKDYSLRSPLKSLIAINIPSFAAGLDLWSPSQRLGIINKTQEKEKLENLLKHEQKLGDGKLEFLAFKGILQLGMERALSGRGQRICCGSGPFQIDFKDLTPAEGSADHRIYFQVDGEFFIMTRPILVGLNLKKRIKVLASAEKFASSPHRFLLAD